jgi:hypothetical protein
MPKPNYYHCAICDTDYDTYADLIRHANSHQDDADAGNGPEPIIYRSESYEILGANIPVRTKRYRRM